MHIVAVDLLNKFHLFAALNALDNATQLWNSVQGGTDCGDVSLAQSNTTCRAEELHAISWSLQALAMYKVMIGNLDYDDTVLMASDAIIQEIQPCLEQESSVICSATNLITSYFAIVHASRSVEYAQLYVAAHDLRLHLLQNWIANDKDLNQSTVSWHAIRPIVRTILSGNVELQVLGALFLLNVGLESEAHVVLASANQRFLSTPADVQLEESVGIALVNGRLGYPRNEEKILVENFHRWHLQTPGDITAKASGQFLCFFYCLRISQEMTSVLCSLVVNREFTIQANLLESHGA